MVNHHMTLATRTGASVLSSEHVSMCSKGDWALEVDQWPGKDGLFIQPD